MKDIRGSATEGITIRMDDDRTIAQARAVCAAVRAAGFVNVHVDIEEAEAAEDAEEEIVSGRMPLPNYRRIHRGAQLTDLEAAILIDALEQMAEATD